jgi:uncharacterized DUF497 family protein
VITFNEQERQANLEKHGLDLADASLVYDAPNKITLISPGYGEERKQDIALVEIMGVVLALAYVERGEEGRAISLRRASRPERKLYEVEQQN